MEFDKTRVYTAVNADELKAGDLVIAALNLDEITGYIESGEYGKPVVLVGESCNSFQQLYDCFVFPDDSTPCGELVEE